MAIFLVRRADIVGQPEHADQCMGGVAGHLYERHVILCTHPSQASRPCPDVQLGDECTPPHTNRKSPKIFGYSKHNILICKYLRCGPRVLQTLDL
ncbi:hypothetical protein BgiMline_009344 [Biomphalaria glabrata]